MVGFGGGWCSCTGVGRVAGGWGTWVGVARGVAGFLECGVAAFGAQIPSGRGECRLVAVAGTRCAEYVGLLERAGVGSIDVGGGDSAPRLGGGRCDPLELGAFLLVSRIGWTLALDLLSWFHPKEPMKPPPSAQTDPFNPKAPLFRVRVKICGITNAADAEAAVDAGADALGFNTWEGSRRYLDIRKAADWLRELPVFVSRVALGINLPLGEALRVADLPYVDLLQLHGDEPVGYCAQVAAAGRSFVRAVRLSGAGCLPALEEWSTRQVLLDAAVPGAFGGTGTLADLDLAAVAVSRFPCLRVTLAGGLDPDNVAEAVRLVRPYAVDVASGVESSPGLKDRAKMRDFVAAVAGVACNKAPQ